MAIQFDCPHCGFHTEVAERFAGQSGSCASCEKPISIPGEAARPAAASTASKTRRPSVSGGLVVAAVLALTLFGITLFAMLFMVTTGSKTSLGGAANAGRKEKQTCCENLERIGNAIDKYVEENGHYPPAYTTDKNGKPMHSWRVLLLPYLDEDKLFASYDMSKPWDDPNNQSIIGKMPDVYLCPTERDITDEASYMVITGEEYLFHQDQTRKPSEIKDGKSSTLMVVEVVKSGIQWTEPQDLDVEKIDWNRNRQQGLGSQHPSGGLHVLMADGLVYHVGDFATPEVLTAMATFQGGEVVDVASWAED